MNWWPGYQYGVPVTVSDTIYNQYIVTQPSTRLALDLDQVKDHLHLPKTCDKSQDNELLMMIKVVQDYVERYTSRTLLTTQFLTFRDGFPYSISLRKSKFQEIVRFQYYSDGVLTNVDPSIYQITQSNDYVCLIPLGNNNWPNNSVDDRKQSVEIEFKAGYGDNLKSIPSALKMGMLNHIASLYANRGDCSCDQAGAEASLPAATKTLYYSYKILNITALETC